MGFISIILSLIVTCKWFFPLQLSSLYMSIYSKVCVYPIYRAGWNSLVLFNYIIPFSYDHSLKSFSSYISLALECTLGCSLRQYLFSTLKISLASLLKLWNFQLYSVSTNLKYVDAHRQHTQLKDGAQLPPPDQLIRQLVELANSENPPCANCDKRDKSTMFFCTTCGM